MIVVMIVAMPVVMTPAATVGDDGFANQGEEEIDDACRKISKMGQNPQVRVTMRCAPSWHITYASLPSHGCQTCRSRIPWTTTFVTHAQRAMHVHARHAVLARHACTSHMIHMSRMAK